MANGNFILPASTQHASNTKAGVVKIGNGIKIDNNGAISVDLSASGSSAASRLNTQMDVDNTGNVVIKRTEGAFVNDMQKYISIWVATYKKANNGNLSQAAYKTFIEGTGNDPLNAVDPTTIKDVNGNAFSAADYTTFGITIGSPIKQFSGKYPDGLRKIFEIQDHSGADLFAVKANGDASIAGIIEINGTGLSKFNGDVQVGGNLTVLGNADVKGIMTGNTFEITGDLKVDGNTFLGDNAAVDITNIKGYTSIQNQYNRTTVQTAVDGKIAAWKTAHPGYTMSQLNTYRIGPVSAGVGNSLSADLATYTDVFTLLDSTNAPIFQVKPNGDTIVAGVLSVNGSGESYFQGDVNINGSLVVNKDATVKGIMSGNDFEVQGNLKVDGNTTLGDNSAVDITTIKGYTSIQHQYGKSEVQTAVDTALATWKAAHNGYTMTDLNNYRIGPKGAAGTSLASDVAKYIDAMAVIDKDGLPIFEVKSNGDTVIGGVLSVNGAGESYFQGDVNINGSLVVNKDATVKGLFNGDTFQITGSTILGDKLVSTKDGSHDTVRVQTDLKKSVIDPLKASFLSTATNFTDAAFQTFMTTNYPGIAYTNATASHKQAYFESKNADYAIDVFSVTDGEDKKLFQVKGNGDTIIAGVVTVNGNGESYFAGDVTVGGRLNVKEQTAGDGSQLNLGENVEIVGNLLVDGNTQLGDNAAVDTTLIKGVTTIKSGKTIDVGSALINVFQVVDSADKALFEVRENGDAVVAGKITVKSTGSSFAGNTTFEGNVNIGGNLTVDGSASAKADLSGNNLTLTGNLIVKGNTQLGDVSDITDAAQYNDTLTIYGKSTVINTGINTTDGNALTSEVFGIHSLDNKNLFQVFGDGSVQVANNLNVTNNATAKLLLGSSASLTGNLDMNSHSIINLANPVSSTDAVNKAYVDNYATGLDIKAAVRVTTTNNITLSGLQTIDGIALVVGDRVLVKDQTNKAENGIYTAASGTWPRSEDANDTPLIGEVHSGMFTFVKEGTSNKDTGWTLITPDTPIDLGNTQLIFTQFAGAGSITAGDGLIQTGTVLSLKPATTTTIGGVIVGSGLTVDADGKIAVGNVSGIGDGTASLSNISKTDVANSIAQRTADGSLVAKNLELTGKVNKVNNIATEGNYGVQTILKANTDMVTSSTTLSPVTSYTVPTGKAGGYLVHIYFVVSAETGADITVDYNDGTAQKQYIVESANSNTQIAGSYSVAPLFIYAAQNTDIVVSSGSTVTNALKVFSAIAAI